jgi:hypothetical protein
MSDCRLFADPNTLQPMYNGLMGVCVASDAACNGVPKEHVATGPGACSTLTATGGFCCVDATIECFIPNAGKSCLHTSKCKAGTTVPRACPYFGNSVVCCDRATGVVAPPTPAATTSQPVVTPGSVRTFTPPPTVSTIFVGTLPPPTPMLSVVDEGSAITMTATAPQSASADASVIIIASAVSAAMLVLLVVAVVLVIVWRKHTKMSDVRVSSETDPERSHEQTTLLLLMSMAACQVTAEQHQNNCTTRSNRSRATVPCTTKFPTQTQANLNRRAPNTRSCALRQHRTST